jgi:hypothetical protein
MLVLFFYFRLFKKRKLDVLIVTAHRAGSASCIVHIMHHVYRLDIAPQRANCFFLSPGCSAHNWWIEHLWSCLSKQLTGVVYDCCYDGDTEPPCAVPGLDAEEIEMREKKVFEDAARRQSGIWDGLKFNKHPVVADVPPDLHEVFSTKLYVKVCIYSHRLYGAMI